MEKCENSNQDENKEKKTQHMKLSKKYMKNEM